MSRLSRAIYYSMLSRLLLCVASALLLKELYEHAAGLEGAWDVRTLALTLALAVVGHLLSARAADGAGEEPPPAPPPAPPRLPVLAVDLDEVCGGYLPAYILFSNAVHGTELSLDDFDSYMFWQVPKARLASREASIERVYEFHASKYFARIEPIPGARHALGILRERFELHVVTSRQSDIEPQTREWVDRHFPDHAPHACMHMCILSCMCMACVWHVCRWVDRHFPDTFAALHFGNHFGKSGAKVSKPDMCARIGAVALLDDSYDYATQVQSPALFRDLPPSPAFSCPLLTFPPRRLVRLRHPVRRRRAARVSLWRVRLEPHAAGRRTRRAHHARRQLARRRAGVCMPCTWHAREDAHAHTCTHHARGQRARRRPGAHAAGAPLLIAS